jgi:beta-lactamase superfamily II metal-dependent hydrolase
LGRAASLVTNFVKAGWGSEVFAPGPTSRENEMSVVQYAELNGHRILLTADTGREGLAEAADYAPSVGIQLPGITRFRVPHHGGRHNVSTELLDKWLGPRLPRILPEGSETFTAMISSAKEDVEHPRKSVVRAMRHRGAFVATTEEQWFSVYSHNAPARGLLNLKNTPYPDEQEA